MSSPACLSAALSLALFGLLLNDVGLDVIIEGRIGDGGRWLRSDVAKRHCCEIERGRIWCFIGGVVIAVWDHVADKKRLMPRLTVCCLDSTRTETVSKSTCQLQNWDQKHVFFKKKKKNFPAKRASFLLRIRTISKRWRVLRC